MGRQAFNVLGMIRTKAIYSTEYKNYAYAVAEVVDNAIDAGASKVVIYIKTIHVDEEYLLELYVLNNGKHISYENVSDVLTYGYTFEESKAIGKFGVGFKQALFSMCKRIDLFSIPSISNNSLFHGIFDTEEMLQNQSEEIGDPLIDTIENTFEDTLVPEVLRGFAKDGYDEAVIVKGSKFSLNEIQKREFEKELQYDLGRIYRYYISSSNSLCINKQSGKLQLSLLYDNDNSISIHPIDPLFLMSDDTHLYFPQNYKIHTSSSVFGKPLFESYKSKKTVLGFELLHDDRSRQYIYKKNTISFKR